MPEGVLVVLNPKSFAEASVFPMGSTSTGGKINYTARRFTIVNSANYLIYYICADRKLVVSRTEGWVPGVVGDCIVGHFLDLELKLVSVHPLTTVYHSRQLSASTLFLQMGKTFLSVSNFLCLRP